MIKVDIPDNYFSNVSNSNKRFLHRGIRIFPFVGLFSTGQYSLIQRIPYEKYMYDFRGDLRPFKVHNLFYKEYLLNVTEIVEFENLNDAIFFKMLWYTEPTEYPYISFAADEYIAPLSPTFQRSKIIQWNNGTQSFGVNIYDNYIVSKFPDPEIVAWLRNNDIPFNITIQPNISQYFNCFRFKSKDDALYFKLTWG